MILDQIERAAGWLAVVVAGLGALGWLTRKGWQMFKRLDRLLHLVELVEKEMRPNGGGSLRDQIDKVSAKIDTHVAEHARPPVTVNVGQPTQPP